MALTIKDLITIINEEEHTYPFVGDFQEYMEDEYKSIAYEKVDEKIIEEILKHVENFFLEYPDELIYYRDAINFIENENITDFSEAITNGYEDLTGIANYYYAEKQLDECETFKQKIATMLKEEFECETKYQTQNH